MRGRLLVSSAVVLGLLATSVIAARVASSHSAVGYHPTPTAAPLSVAGSIPLAHLEAIDGPTTTTTAPPPPPLPRHFSITVNRSAPIAYHPPVAAPAVTGAGCFEGGKPVNCAVCIRSHESGGNYADNTGNGFYGAYQYLISTWASYDGYYRPDQAPPSVQDARFWADWNSEGVAGRQHEWPRSSRACGD